MLPNLLGQIPEDQRIGMVTADGACDTRACHNAVANRGVHAVSPTRRNAKPWKPSTPGAEARNEILKASKYLGEPFGEDGAAIIAEVLSRPICAVPNFWVTELWQASSIARSSNYKFGPLCSTVSPRLASQKPTPLDEFVWERGTCLQAELCNNAQEVLSGNLDADKTTLKSQTRTHNFPEGVP